MPKEIRAYFEGVTGINESKCIRYVPFRHSRKIRIHQREETSEKYEYRNWFTCVEPEYMDGVVYNLGQKKRRNKLFDEKQRIESMILGDQEILLPMVVTAVG